MFYLIKEVPSQETVVRVLEYQKEVSELNEKINAGTIDMVSWRKTLKQQGLTDVEAEADINDKVEKKRSYFLSKLKKEYGIKNG